MKCWPLLASILVMSALSELFENKLEESATFKKYADLKVDIKKGSNPMMDSTLRCYDFKLMQ